MSGDPLDIQQPMDGGWNEWRYLVLHEIRRLTDNFEKVDEKIDLALRQQELDRQKMEDRINSLEQRMKDARDAADKQFSILQDTLHNKDTGLSPRMDRVETNSLLAEAIKKYRGWIITSVIFIIVGVGIPIANFVRGM